MMSQEDEANANVLLGFLDILGAEQFKQFETGLIHRACSNIRTPRHEAAQERKISAMHFTSRTGALRIGLEAFLNHALQVSPFLAVFLEQRVEHVEPSTSQSLTHAGMRHHQALDLRCANLGFTRREESGNGMHKLMPVA